MENIATPHDLFFKKFLSDKAIVVDLIRSYLPENVVGEIDFKTLKYVPGRFIDNRLQVKKTDVLLQAKMRDSVAYFYLLFEHQSTPEPKMPLRSAQYLLKIIERHMALYKTDSVPFVFPIIFYNGDKPYPYHTDIQKMLIGPDELVSKFRLGNFHLIDLTQIPDEQLRAATWTNLCCFAMKHARSRHLEGIIQYIITQLEILSQISDKEEYSSMQEPLLCYIINAYGNLDREKFMDMLKKSTSEYINTAGKTLADQFREEGFQKGQRALIQEMLGRGAAVEAVSELTGFSKEEILKCAEQLVSQ